jgi:glutamyl-tRNA(Gln) amidotransferase subunit E
VPAETRQAQRDGTTGFERILPGADRMYPDTDTPPLPVDDALVGRIRATLPETPWARVNRYRALGLADAAAHRLARSPWARAFDDASPPAGDLARRLADSLGRRVPWHARRGRPIPERLGERLRAVVAAMAAGQIRAEALGRLVDLAITRPETPPDALLAPFRTTAPAIEEVIESAGRRAGGLAGRSPETLLRWAMGEVMRPLLGRADPALVRRMLAERLAPRPSQVAP